MKTKVQVLKITILAFLLGVSHSAEAQFWKKLTKKVERQVENAVTEKVAQKSAEKASKSTDSFMESILNPEFGENSQFSVGGNMGSVEDLADSYDFEWSYVLLMESEQVKDTMKMEYLLKPDTPYWGMRMNSQQSAGMPMLIIYDNERKQSAMFMETQGSKMAMVYKLPVLDSTAKDQAMNDAYTFEKIAGKTILGYSCDGFIAESPEHKMTYYVTFDAPVSLNDVYGRNNKLPKNFDPEWLKKDGKQGLMMQMDFLNKKKPKQSAKMTCVELKEQDFTITPKDYSGLMDKGE